MAKKSDGRKLRKPKDALSRRDFFRSGTAAGISAAVLSAPGEAAAQGITWNYEADYEGTKVTLVFKGTVEAGTSITGKIESSGTSGDFTAKKQ